MSRFTETQKAITRDSGVKNGSFEITIISSKNGRKACFDIARGRFLKRHILKGEFSQQFTGSNTIGGYVGSTDLVVDEFRPTPNSDRIVRARFGGTLRRKNTKNGTEFEMIGGQTVYVAHGETKLLGDKNVSITYNGSSKSNSELI